MENENKNGSAPAQNHNHSGNHKKNRPQKPHKPYYIEPAGEQAAEAQGKGLQELTLEEMEAVWQEAKKEE